MCTWSPSRSEGHSGIIIKLRAKRSISREIWMKPVRNECSRKTVIFIAVTSEWVCTYIYVCTFTARAKIGQSQLICKSLVVISTLNARRRKKEARNKKEEVWPSQEEEFKGFQTSSSFNNDKREGRRRSRRRPVCGHPSLRWKITLSRTRDRPCRPTTHDGSKRLHLRRGQLRGQTN